MTKEKFGYGHTKIFFRAGVLGLMEEIRDDKVTLLTLSYNKWTCFSSYLDIFANYLENYIQLIL